MSEGMLGLDVPENFEADAVWGFEAFAEGLGSWSRHWEIWLFWS
jgi:hypothetical protein